MRVYAGMDPRLPLRDIPEHARRIERLGYDGLHIAETVHDPFLASMAALQSTTRLVVRTSVALALVRSPMAVAYSAWDLAALSDGRFQLGLGTQIRPHIERRFGADFDDPVGRLRDHIGAVRACWRAFDREQNLDYASEHYTLDLLTPNFTPDPLGPDVRRPTIWMGGVNRRLLETAGRLADGFVTHPTNSHPRYLREVCRPGLAAGASEVGRSVDDIELVVGTQWILGVSAADLHERREHNRRLLAFLYSTPAYERTLELFGWSDLAGRLRSLIRESRWDELSQHVTDEVLDTLVPQATYAELPRVAHEWFGGLVAGVLIAPPPSTEHDDALATAVAELRRA
ncbi:MAG: TIGR03617 family F420-dependent LLM class oxidoreductase [Actinomycetota bacterium]